MMCASRFALGGQRCMFCAANHPKPSVVMRQFPLWSRTLVLSLAGAFAPVIARSQAASPFDRLPFRSVGPAVHGGRLHDDPEGRAVD